MPHVHHVEINAQTLELPQNVISTCSKYSRLKFTRQAYAVQSRAEVRRDLCREKFMGQK